MVKRKKLNREKIMDYLQQNSHVPITTTVLAEEIDIDIKNISRYLKQLEREEQIGRFSDQQGKIRFVYNFYWPTKK